MGGTLLVVLQLLQMRVSKDEFCGTWRHGEEEVRFPPSVSSSARDGNSGENSGCLKLKMLCPSPSESAALVPFSPLLLLPPLVPLRPVAVVLAQVVVALLLLLLLPSCLLSPSWKQNIEYSNIVAVVAVALFSRFQTQWRASERRSSSSGYSSNNNRVPDDDDYEEEGKNDSNKDKNNNS